MPGSQEFTFDVRDTADIMCKEVFASKTSLSAENGRDLAIAPFLASDEDGDPPTPPPKSPRRQERQVGFAHKPSFASFALPRQPSIPNFFAARHGRPSESHSIADSSTSHRTNSTTSTTSTEITQPQTPHAIRKSKSSIFTAMLKKSRSRARLRSDTSDHIHPYSQSQAFLSPPQDSVSSFLSMGSPSPPTTKHDRLRSLRRKPPTAPPAPPLPRQPETAEQEFTLDTNIDEMDGIIDFTVVLFPKPPDYIGPLGNSSTSVPNGRIVRNGYSPNHADSPSPSSSMFHNPDPFHPTLSSSRRPVLGLDYRRVCPKTVLPLGAIPPPENSQDYVNRRLPESPTWIPPESWAVDKEGEVLDDVQYSSSDEGPPSSRPMSFIPPGHKRKSRRKTMKVVQPIPVDYKTYKIRIYKMDGEYHICSIPLSTTVADLTPVLNRKVRMQVADQEVHRLYLKERGRERVLAQTEKPADIVRRRLEQAGYDVKDGLDRIGVDDISFLLKFQYKSQLLGPADSEFDFENFEYVDLTGRSLIAIPVSLHKQAETLVTLTLSRNPMLEIPLDFIQACVTLRELRLSHMAMKKVPQSVRHSVTLHLLDISCNRIVDLDDAGLDRIPELRSLKAQNNRMEKLPWYFPRLRCLKYLNISNNKFKHIPTVVGDMTSLVDLDVSFNMISELPAEIGQLTALERFIIVGNQVSKLPIEYKNLASLKVLDCRRNLISDLSIVCVLPRLETLRADHNAIHGLDLSLGPLLLTLDASYNDITRLTLAPNPISLHPYALKSLDISHAKLSSLDDLAFSQLSSLQSLKIDHNSIRFIPESLGELTQLTLLSCSDNELIALPTSIGRLQRLETLDAHNNSLTELPASLWNCASLTHINATSNLIRSWQSPPALAVNGPLNQPSADSLAADRKASVVSTHSGRYIPPLAHSLERLYLGENQFTDDSILPLMVFKELTVLNLSFNELQDLPPNFFRGLTLLEELYLSGNKLTTIPTEDLHRLTRLSVLFLNGNRLQTLPQEIGKLQSLAVLDVGSNILRYNINNLEFDWNWNFNQNLRYLNFSGNKRLEIKPDPTGHSHRALSTGRPDERILADFSKLTQLRVLGLMDVTTTFLQNEPEDTEERRVRTSFSTVNKMAYGIADNLGRHLGKHTHLTMLDLVQPEFRDRKDEAVFAMFGRSQSVGNKRITKFLHDNFLSEFATALDELDPERGEGIPDALRRAFLHLNKSLHDKLFDPAARRKASQGSDAGIGGVASDSRLIDSRSGASGVVLYLIGKTLFIANAGDALAVVSRRGAATPLSRKHDPFDRQETARIRAAEGWVSPKGTVNDEVDVSRSFGFYHLFPVINARPDICKWDLSDLDEFVVIGNRGLWDYVDYQTAVDIARSERADPMIAAQKLRDFAISYGAEGSTMIMVISVGDLFTSVSRRPMTDALVVDPRRARKRDDIAIRNITRLDGEVSPPTGHVTLVFTDIRNSTHLWEVNPGMPTAMRLHNNLLRRQLRFCGGYEVKTEGDAFMCSFPTVLSALWWCMSVQSELLKEPWPLEILECEDGKEIRDADGTVIARGLSVRMGVHCGTPLCEPDPITRRMDYFGPMVNRSARITARAAGGQIMVSSDVVREINAKITETDAETEYSDLQPPDAILAIKDLGISVISVGEVKLKGLEVPETLSVVYPKHLAARQDLEQGETVLSASNSRVQFSVEQIRDLARLCVRLEALSMRRMFRSLAECEPGITSPTLLDDNDGLQQEEQEETLELTYNADTLFPCLSATASYADLMAILQSLSIRLMNVVPALCLKMAPMSDARGVDKFMDALAKHGPLDDRTLAMLLSALGS